MKVVCVLFIAIISSGRRERRTCIVTNHDVSSRTRGGIQSYMSGESSLFPVNLGS
ncbi:MAG: hypothetical protein VX908_03590 [Planctomycetota bacterium]|nr:hypothetical protein [Planctomycetota bacterium]